MNKKIVISIVIVLLLVLFIVIKVITSSNGLEKYELLKDEIVLKEFTYNKKKYVLTSYYDDKNSYATNNILIKNNKDYYYLGKIDKCDMSYLIDKNNIYVHCIGKEGNILKYDINNLEELEILDFDYTNTPNISQIHINIEKVDKKYIYLKSNVKIDENVAEGEHVKCSFKDKKCEYN